jgi:4-hydroxy-4-methyl-2-oxoglutarate aldolase
MDHASAVEGLKWVLFGPAVTISYFPSCSASHNPERYNLANLFYEAVGNEPEGKVLVLASNGTPRSRWVVEPSSLAFSTMVWQVSSPTVACGTSTNWRAMSSLPTAPARPHGGVGGEVTPFQANVPVVLSGVGVIPGQYVFADSSGVVLILQGELEQVLAEAHSIEADDARYREQIAREDRPSA